MRLALTITIAAATRALAIGYFKGHAGVQDFFAKLIGPGTGQQTDSLFEPKEYYVSPKSVHVIGIETGYLSAQVLGGTVACAIAEWDAGAG